MHAKPWIFDEQYVLTGSMNMTHHGVNDNKEHCFWISQKDAVADVVRDFHETWSQLALEVTADDVERMMDKWRDRKSPSRSRRPPIRRSLSEQFAEEERAEDTV
mgnify:CR=1 FL=1